VVRLGENDISLQHCIRIQELGTEFLQRKTKVQART